MHVYGDAVDGDCDMMSVNDAAVTSGTTLTPAPAARIALPLAFALARLVT